MSNKPDNIQIKNKFAPTFDIQQQLDTINQQNLSNAKYDNYSSDGLNLGKTPSHSLKNSVNVGGETVGGSKPKLCNKTKKRIQEDVKICNFHPNDFHYKGKWKNHEIYVDTKDKNRAAKQIFFMFANQMDMKTFNYELVNEKNGVRSSVKGSLNKEGKAELKIIKKTN